MQCHGFFASTYYWWRERCFLALLNYQVLDTCLVSSSGFLLLLSNSWRVWDWIGHAVAVRVVGWT